MTPRRIIVRLPADLPGGLAGQEFALRSGKDLVAFLRFVIPRLNRSQAPPGGV